MNIGQKIKQERERLGWNQSELARKAGIKPQNIQQLEQGTISNSKHIFKIAEALNLRLDSLIGQNKNLVNESEQFIVEPLFIKVRGAVQAGYWTEALEWPQEEWFDAFIGKPDSYPIDKKFGLIVKGDSMDVEFKENTILECIPIEYMQGKLEDDDYVIVEREHAGKYEATVKQIEFRGDLVFLWPRSHNPDFQSPLVINDPESPYKMDNTTIRVTALVIGVYKNLERKKIKIS